MRPLGSVSTPVVSNIRRPSVAVDSVSASRDESRALATSRGKLSDVTLPPETTRLADEPSRLKRRSTLLQIPRSRLQCGTRRLAAMTTRLSFCELSFPREGVTLPSGSVAFTPEGLSFTRRPVSFGFSSSSWRKCDGDVPIEGQVAVATSVSFSAGRAEFHHCSLCFHDRDASAGRSGCVGAVVSP